jgi:hypothetical protein
LNKEDFQLVLEERHRFQNRDRSFFTETATFQARKLWE